MLGLFRKGNIRAGLHRSRERNLRGYLVNAALAEDNEEAMTMVKSIAAALGASALVLLGAASCATGEREQPRPPARAPGAARPAPAAPVLSPRAYFDQATALDLFQLRAADIAMQRGGARARNFAMESKRQHNAIAAQFNFAGRYLDMLPSRVLPTAYQRLLTELLNAPDFDRAYLAREAALCDRASRLHGDYGRRGQSPTLRPIAKFAVNAVASECRLLGK